MKIMDFGEYKYSILNEGRSQEIDQSQFEKILEINCKWVETLPNGVDDVPFFRGTRSSGKYSLINPKEVKRESVSDFSKDRIYKNNSLLYKLQNFLGNGINNRNYSVIFSNSQNIAKRWSKNYFKTPGMVYQTIPFDNSLLTYIPDHDFNLGFSQSWDDFMVEEFPNGFFKNKFLSNFLKEEDIEIAKEIIPKAILKSFEEEIIHLESEMKFIKTDSNFWQNYNAIENVGAREFWTDCKCLLKECI